MTAPTDTARWDHIALTDFVAALFTRVGLDEGKARAVAEILVEGDLLGHTTHGLALLPPNLAEAEGGRMALAGDPEIVAATPTVETWDGRRLPGPWLVRRAADLCSERARTQGMAGVAIRKATHIGCLAAYLAPIATRGQMLILASSDPSTASVAPFGGTRRIYTPNPLAAGWPTPEGMVLLDISMSITTNGMTARLRDEGSSFDHPCLLDAEGRPTRDPNAFFTDPPGSLLPLGGAESGHKGYALGLLLEALTSALSGYGRADGEARWGANCFVLVIDPARFGGIEAFTRETGWMERAVHENLPGPGVDAVRLPGERALARRRDAIANGLVLHPSLPPMLAAQGQRLGVALPPPKA
jgi:LDH2 family malate/lactate/ureidoglycolate dehydrogenase